MPLTENTTPIHNGVTKDKAVSTLIREVGAQNQEEEDGKSKTPEHWSWVDLEERNSFHEGVGAGMLKCATGHAHHGCRNEKNNNGLVRKSCLRFN